MSSGIEYIDIILLAMIAGFIILRLKNILGRKTGFQRKPDLGRSSAIFDGFLSTSLWNWGRWRWRKQRLGGLNTK